MPQPRGRGSIGHPPRLLYDWQAVPPQPSPPRMRLPVLPRLAATIEAINAQAARIAAWCVLALVMAQVAIVALRAGFGMGSVWLQESLFYFHAAAFLLTAAQALKEGGHVRVDIIFERLSDRARALIDLCGALLLLIPFMVVLLSVSWPYAARSWAIFERSHESGGLPAVFLLKSLIPLFAVLMALQGLALALRAAIVLRTARPQAVSS